MSALVSWWSESIDEVGVQGMDKLLDRDAGWDAVLKSGREDVQLAIQLTGMRTGKDRALLDLGCGIGRLSHALADHFRSIVGVDVAAGLIEKARQHNTSPRLQFETIDGQSLTVAGGKTFHTVFCHEVLYYLPHAVVQNYMREAFRVLEPGGEFVFQLNCYPFTLRTRASYLGRDLLRWCGIKHWRGWPTSRSFRRYPYTIDWTVAQLKAIGFENVRVCNTQRLQQVWFVAEKA